MNELKRLLEETRQNFYFTDRFSPVIRLSAYFSFKYFEAIKKKENVNIPFFISFPDKKYSSVWLTTLLQLSFFLEDYVNSEKSLGIKLIQGKKYSVFGSVFIFDGEVNDRGINKYSLRFSDTNALIGKKVSKMFSSVNQNRQLNKYKHYIERKKDAKNNRTPLSKIFEPVEGIIINDNVFISNILLITGIGNKGEINRIFENALLEEDSIKKILSPNDNIIIKPDLRDYTAIFDNNYEDNLNKFKEFLNKLADSGNQNTVLKDRLNSLLNSINEDGITKAVNEDFDDIIEIFSEEEPRLNYLKKKFPGIIDGLPDNLRAIVINDISQLQLYPATINAFLSQKIPVIILADRLPRKIEELDTFNQWFDSEDGIYKDAWRFNWNKSKLKQVNELFGQENNFLDQELWNICKRYSHQSVKIKVFESPQPDLDSQISFLRNRFVNLNGFEYLKTAFYQYLYPALWALKDSGQANDESTQLIINSFKKIWEQNRDYLNDNELQECFDVILNENTIANFQNTKQINTNNLFCQVIAVPDKEGYKIPVNCGNNILPKANTNKITFSGFPYKEYVNKHLTNAVIKYFIPEIKILCWPQEGKQTYGYLKRRIKAGYFTDNLSDEIKFPDAFLLENEENFENEINELLTIENLGADIPNEASDEETDFIKLDNLQYEKYRNNNNIEGRESYLVKCNILRFEDGCFMFLPTNSRILADSEGDDSVRKQKFNELSVGMNVYKIRSNINYDFFIKNKDEINRAYNDIKIWKDILKNLYKSYETEEELGEYLLGIANQYNLDRANPSILNIRRWMYDDEIIAPTVDNVTLLIYAGIERNMIKNNVEELVDQIMNASGFIRGIHIKAGRMIKKAIASQLSNNNINIEPNFKVRIPDTNIKVEVDRKTIAELQQSEFEVEYTNTREFLC